MIATRRITDDSQHIYEKSGTAIKITEKQFIELAGNPPFAGEMRKGIELGRKDTGRYIWQLCPVCGKGRWVQIRVRKGNSIKVRVCASCRGSLSAGANSTQWKGGRYKEKSGYVVVYLTAADFFFPMATRTGGRVSHKYGGYVQEHRLVMAKHLGRCLHRWELVHHKNGIKDDNRIENLELVSGMGEHARVHNEGYKNGYKKGFLDGRSARINQLLARIKELESKN